MDLHISLGMIGLIVAILAHGGSWVWFASKMATKVDSLVISIQRLDKEMEKRDDNQQRMWARIDEIRDMIHKP